MKTNKLFQKALSAAQRVAFCAVAVLLAMHLLSHAPAEAVYATQYTFSALLPKALPGSANGTGVTGFSCVEGVAVDCAGTVYVASARNQTISRMTPDGIVTILAGCPGVSGSADGTGTNARFSFPRGLAVDKAGNVFVADSRNGTIRRVTPAGKVTTLAGEAGCEGSADGIGVNAQFLLPMAVALDGAGNIYVADALNDEIRKVTPGGRVTTLAGQPRNEGSADGRGGQARFFCPAGLAVDKTGNVYVADSGNNLIRKVTPRGVVTTLAGQLNYIEGGADGRGKAAHFFHPEGLAVDTAGNVYVTDTGDATIRRLTPAGEVETLGGFAGATGTTDGAGRAARFTMPLDVTIDGAGNLYVADAGNGALRKGIPTSTFAVSDQPRKMQLSMAERH